jgi:hypothetical protein
VTEIPDCTAEPWKRNAGCVVCTVCANMFSPPLALDHCGRCCHRLVFRVANISWRCWNTANRIAGFEFSTTCFNTTQICTHNSGNEAVKRTRGKHKKIMKHGVIDLGLVFALRSHTPKQNRGR